MRRGWLCAGLVAVLLAGCAGGGGSQSGGNTAASGTKSAGGRYAMDSDAYPDQPPDVSNVPDAVPRVEPLSRSGNRPTYEVWGKTYHVLSDPAGYEKRGTASWYGEKFHGYATASGEIYDMYKMSAAHRSLPLPTYARVTSLDNDRSVIVKVNDRGPFHGDRLIDLSYAAAARLDILGNGTGRVRVEAIDPVAWQAQHGGGQRSVASGGSGTRAASPASKRVAAASSPSASMAKPQAAKPEPAAPATPAVTRTEAPREATNAPAPQGDSAGDRFYLQVAALGSATSARALQTELQGEIGSPVRIDSDSRLHRVQVGPVRDRLALEALRSELRRVGYAQAFTITASE